jgi:hypothetical protein
MMGFGKGSSLAGNEDEQKRIKLTDEEEAAIAARPTMQSQHLLRKHFERETVERQRKALDGGSADATTRPTIKPHFGHKFKSFEYVPFDRERDTGVTMSKAAEFEKKGWAGLGYSGGFDSSIGERFEQGRVSHDE